MALLLTRKSWSDGLPGGGLLLDEPVEVVADQPLDGIVDGRVQPPEVMVPGLFGHPEGVFPDGGFVE
jgi:hypothetical protein